MRTTRRLLTFLIAIAPLAFLDRALPRAPAAEPKKPPNVVFILADDLGYNDVGCYNPKCFYETPNLDRLAARGMRFTAGYAACPVCSPTRASILTGKYPVRTGITDFIGGSRSGRMNPAPYQHQLALQEVTLAESFKSAGYETFFAGKWHLGAGESGPGAQGFDPSLKGPSQFFYPADGPRPDRESKDDPKTTDVITEDAIRFIRNHRDRPFFAYLPYLAVHIPIGARPDLVEKFRRKPPAGAEVPFGTEHRNRVRLQQSEPVYAAMLAQLDQAVGRLMETLEQTGLADRTIVVFVSDNGGLSTAEGHPTSNLPLRAGKGWVYEGGIRVPWIVDAPGITRPGSVCDTPVTTTDFYPTLLALAGLPPAPRQHVDGMNLMPLLAGGMLDRGPLFWHYPHYSNQGGPPAGAMRDGDWKLIEWYEDGRLELYNLHNDPSERHDLASRHPEKARAMRERLAAWRKETHARMPVEKP
jgi:arylsulfatase A-like enzyme